MVVATGDVHNINKEDLIYREIIANQNVPGKGRHPLARYLNGYKKNNTNEDNILLDINKAKDMEIDYVFVIGDENYYKRFGFVDASKYNVQFNDLLPFTTTALSIYDSAFSISTLLLS